MDGARRERRSRLRALRLGRARGRSRFGPRAHVTGALRAARLQDARTPLARRLPAWGRARVRAPRRTTRRPGRHRLQTERRPPPPPTAGTGAHRSDPVSPAGRTRASAWPRSKLRRLPRLQVLFGAATREPESCWPRSPAAVRSKARRSNGRGLRPRSHARATAPGARAASDRAMGGALHSGALPVGRGS